MAADIQVHIGDTNVTPETVELADLIGILRNLHVAIAATVHEHGGEAKISLKAVDSGGSEVLTFFADRATSESADLLAKAIEMRDATLLPQAARVGLLEIWKKARQKSWPISIQRQANGTVGAVGTIDPKVDLFTTPTVRGDTTLLVYLLRVGGENPPTAQFRTGSQTLTTRIASQEVAEELGGYLYKFVQLSGRATWSANDFKLLDFRIRGVGPFSSRDSNPVGALEELAEASDGFWDTVDPEEFVADLRDED